MDRRDHFDEVWRQKLQAGTDQSGGNRRVAKAVSLLSQGDRLLDIGCGAGELGIAATSRFREIHGIDISSAATQIASQRGIQARVLDVGSERLPYSDGTFDAVTAMSVLQLVVDLEALLRECRRVLRPGGQFVASVPNMRAAWRLWRLAVEGRFPRTSLDNVGVDGGALHYFTSQTTRDIFSRSGFQIVTMLGIYCIPRWFEERWDIGPMGWIKREFMSGEVLVEARTLPRQI